MCTLMWCHHVWLSFLTTVTVQAWILVEFATVPNRISYLNHVMHEECSLAESSDKVPFVITLQKYVFVPMQSTSHV